MEKEPKSNRPKSGQLLPLLFLIGSIVFSVGTLVLFSSTQHTPTPEAWGIPSGTRNSPFIWINMILQTLFLGVGVSLLGFFILHRSGQQQMGWLLTFLGLFLALYFFFLEWTVFLNFTLKNGPLLKNWVAWIANWIWFPLNTLLILIVSLFPNGRFYSRPWRWIIVIPLALMVSILLAQMISQPLNSAFFVRNPLVSTPPERLFNILLSTGLIAMPTAALLAFISTILRFRQSSGRERHQMKWLLAGVGLVAIQFSLGILLAIQFDSIIGELLVNYASFGVILGVGVALIRHNLYDIDLIIRRTLVYSIVSAVLAAVYFTSVLLIQSTITAVGGQQSAVVTVISTLIIAALFNPLRQRIQAIIDKRFYRSKYDAQQTLAQFAATARDEVDLEQLTDALVNVIQQTMQPEMISVWLRPTIKSRGQQR